MGSLLEELARREAAARRRIEGLRQQISELTERLGAEEDRLSRLVVTRETVEEILGEAASLVEEPEEEGGSADAAGTEEGPPEVVRLGVVTVPRWRSGMGTKVLPQAYRDAVEILVDGGGPMRAGQLLVAMGLQDAASTREGLWSKLKRLVERGWLEEVGAGLFMVTEQVTGQVTGRASKRGPAGSGDGIGSSPPQ
ncbi:hypothetical protein [Nonomuraea sp. NPDC049625]|uniref:hypothetical protein n=1 Tax=Nonomuraea sp. NPDC049625 TaxID=3155775 RepID=UPI0034240473